jgi:hypothetical protein
MVWLTAHVHKREIGLWGYSIKRLLKMPRDVLTIGIKTLGLVKLAQSRVHASIPRPSPDFRDESESRKSDTCSVFCAETILPRWIERPICRTVWPSE